MQISKDCTGHRLMVSYLENDGVGGLILLDVEELLNSQVGAGEACSNKVGLLELGNCLLIEGRLELLEDIGELWRLECLATACTRKTRLAH